VGALMSKHIIELEDDCLAGIIVKELREQIGVVKSNIKPINKNMKSCQIQDIKDAKEALEHLEYVYDYYGGNIKS
jgi:hypothetical protein